MKKILILIEIFLVLPFLGLQAEEQSSHDFYIEPTYDLNRRTKIKADLITETENLDFYGDQKWWNNLTSRQQDNYIEKLKDLSVEFEEDIHDQMVQIFGKKPIHPVTEEKKVNILFHSMRESAGGYFNSGDQHSKYQNPHSNEMSLLYLNTDVLDYEELGGFLAHEFMHLLTFNQKERLRGVREEIWLNEARAEYMPTFLGYNDNGEGNLEKRTETFLRDPDISLTEWIGQRADYGVVNIFTHYLVDQYGIEILVDSLKSKEVGIKSIEEALKDNGYDKNFSEVFSEFKIAALVNDCQLGERYCFKNEKLKDLKVSPATNYVPFTEDSSISVTYRTKNWAGNWHKITGGQGTLVLDFEVENDLKISIPYLLCGDRVECKIGYIDTNNGEGTLTVEDFDDTYDSLVIMPTIEEKKSGFNGIQESYVFKWTARLLQEETELETLQKLSRLRELLERLKERLLQQQSSPKTSTIRGPLYEGITDSESVVCLQLFLSTQEGIYPEGYVTGNFLRLTKKAVIRFQEKYSSYILEPIGLKEGTGYLGSRTISMINNLR
jgi:hypothetical protein